ncbi:MAG: hypothetical protein U5L45_25665 [Saprospiraceae bacterium]|nr:hypothetical protein [Saprospiraceae bacterium]
MVRFSAKPKKRTTFPFFASEASNSLSDYYFFMLSCFLKSVRIPKKVVVPNSMTPYVCSVIKKIYFYFETIHKFQIRF